MSADKLAINGGTPVRNTPFAPWPYFWDEDKKAVMEVLDSGKVNYWTGFRGMEFQKMYAEFCGVKNAVMVNSGTSALHVALAAAEIGPGDEVIVPTYSFIATAAAVLHQNAIPIFADVDEKTWNIDPKSVESLITERTKAIIAVHLHGHPADMDPIKAIAAKRGIKVIEDAAQAHGGAYKGKMVGGLGDVAAFSFCQDKIMTTGGEGGAVTTDDEYMAEIARSFKDHGYYEEERRDLLQMEALYPYIHHRMGFNYRMTEMQNVIGIECVKRLADWVETRRKNAHYLSAKLAQIPQVEPPYESPDVKHAFYKYAFKVKPETLTCTRDEFIQAIRAEGIPSAAGVPPENYKEEVFLKMVGYGTTTCPFQCPWYKGTVDYSKVNCPTAVKIGAQTVWLLVHPTLNESDMADAAEAVAKIASAYAK